MVTSACFEEVLMSSETFFARKERSALSPSAKRIASVTLDLPEPFGPTRQIKPREREMSAFLKDLKPRIRILDRNIIANPYFPAFAAVMPDRQKALGIKALKAFWSFTRQKKKARCKAKRYCGCTFASILPEETYSPEAVASSQALVSVVRQLT